MKKIIMTIAVGVMMLTLSSCGKTGNPEETPEETQMDAAGELLDLFINGSIGAVDSADQTSEFYITDLNMDSEEWDSYSVGEKVDLDNDGEEELIINGPYGGKYLDARDNKVYEFAAGGGTALALSYTCYDGAVWIIYSNSMNVGYKCYHMKKYEGADNLVAEMAFGEELVDRDNAESGMKYHLNGTEISYDEYTDLCSKIFGEADIVVWEGEYRNILTGNMIGIPVTSSKFEKIYCLGGICNNSCYINVGETLS